MEPNLLDNSLAQFRPVNENSRAVLAKKEFALIGVSPFNSYFTTERITRILQVVIKQFTDFKIFIPNKLSEYTLQAVGYPQARLKEKLRKQDNYLKNKVTTALGNIDPAYMNADKIVTFTDLQNNNSYNELYNICLTKFENDQDFREGCLETSHWVLASVLNNNVQNDSLVTSDINTVTNIDTDTALQIAVQYFLKELPVFLDSPKILGVDSCTFLYQSTPKFLRKIYHSNDFNLVSPDQGFTELHLI